MIYVWADTHFGHAGILRHCPDSRPYDTVEQMNRELVFRWNSVVTSKDRVYLLGDFGFGKDLPEIFAELRGEKHLVMGNHDEQNPVVGKLGWESVSDIVTLREDGVRAVACHYPLESWKSSNRGYLMLHGHSHGTLSRTLPRRFDVGVDVRPSPVSLAQLSVEGKAQSFQPTDHHKDF